VYTTNRPKSTLDDVRPIEDLRRLRDPPASVRRTCSGIIERAREQDHGQLGVYGLIDGRRTIPAANRVVWSPEISKGLRSVTTGGEGAAVRVLPST